MISLIFYTRDTPFTSFDVIPLIAQIMLFTSLHGSSLCALVLLFLFNFLSKRVSENKSQLFADKCRCYELHPWQMRANFTKLSMLASRCLVNWLLLSYCLYNIYIPRKPLEIIHSTLCVMHLNVSINLLYPSWDF